MYHVSLSITYVDSTVALVLKDHSIGAIEISLTSRQVTFGDTGR